MSQLTQGLLLGLFLGFGFNYSLKWLQKFGTQGLYQTTPEYSDLELRRTPAPPAQPRFSLEISCVEGTSRWGFAFQDMNQGTNSDRSKITYRLRTPSGDRIGFGEISEKDLPEIERIFREVREQYSSLTNSGKR